LPSTRGSSSWEKCSSMLLVMRKTQNAVSPYFPHSTLLRYNFIRARPGCPLGPSVRGLPGVVGMGPRRVGPDHRPQSFRLQQLAEDALGGRGAIDVAHADKQHLNARPRFHVHLMISHFIFILSVCRFLGFSQIIPIFNLCTLKNSRCPCEVGMSRYVSSRESLFALWLSVILAA